LNRQNALSTIIKSLDTDDLVIAIFGATSDQLYSLKDRAGNFYMRGGMGLASSIGLGLALAVPERRVIVLDGDASILMNLGSYATIGRESPHNLTHIVFNNESHCTVGGYPTATATNANLESIAKGSGIKHAVTIDNESELEREFNETRASKGPYVIIAKVEKDATSSRANINRLVKVKERFMSAIKREDMNIMS
jgi:sulfopyruvate decarboxylase subunit beta